MKVIKKAVVASLLVTGMSIGVVGVSAGEAKAQVCKITYVISGVGRSTKQSTAKKRARIKWRIKARLLHGTRYDGWEDAINRSYSCSKKWGVWRCRARGKPCRS
ncbi:MAG: hypothetical protein MRY74_05380 [Neomegalonema sp.]|nr:hypothetical protein [Neomegalonema sp.]